ncbi:hypothetical protein HAD_11555 [Hyphomonas adhaerens MHS-3]|uniref:Lipoprotein n=1 Tax=Hyphomonas adhaerens MHS-3 TaxID=1280949 RepID=A0A069E7S6_9PROT|nr:hypothetical protein [Hyphomonas adhaerens]KCZ86320.1 hypothetical protein HAD_11555 [Hyphomonas adhaerens MHS-3]
MKLDWKRAIMSGGVLAGLLCLTSAPAYAEDEANPVGCAAIYRQLNELRSEALAPWTIRKRQINEFEAFDFLAREAKMLELVEADPSMTPADVDTIYAFMAMTSFEGLMTEYSMTPEMIVGTLKTASDCDRHYEFSPVSDALIRHFK